MNIFFLSERPEIAADCMVDSHVIKMSLETAQILCTVLQKNGATKQQFPFLYRPTHMNHGSVVWAGSNRLNFEWTLNHLDALLSNYSSRFNKQHKCMEVFRPLYALYNNVAARGKYLNIPNNRHFGVGTSPTYLAMPDYYKIEEVPKGVKVSLRLSLDGMDVGRSLDFSPTLKDFLSIFFERIITYTPHTPHELLIEGISRGRIAVPRDANYSSRNILDVISYWQYYLNEKLGKIKMSTYGKDGPLPEVVDKWIEVFHDRQELKIVALLDRRVNPGTVSADAPPLAQRKQISLLKPEAVVEIVLRDFFLSLYSPHPPDMDRLALGTSLSVRKIMQSMVSIRRPVVPHAPPTVTATDLYVDQLHRHAITNTMLFNTTGATTTLTEAQARMIANIPLR